MASTLSHAVQHYCAALRQWPVVCLDEVPCVWASFMNCQTALEFDAAGLRGANKVRDLGTKKNEC